MPTDMEIRDRLEHELRRPVRDAVWSHLVKKGYLGDVRSGAENGFRELLDEARALEIIGRAAPSQRAISSIAIKPRLPGLDSRLEALAILHADYATSTDHRVSAFLLQVVPGSPLAPQTALAVLRSPLTARYSATVLKHFGIPIVGHSVEVRRLEQRRLGFDVQHAKGRRTLQWEDHSRQPRADLAYAQGDGEPLVVAVYAGSVLDELRTTAEEISRTYLWEPSEAAAFLLEGRRPAVEPLSVELEQTFSAYPSRATVVIRAEAWLSASLVAEAYRDVQREVLPQGSRAVAARTAAAAAFVADYRRSVKRFTWPSALDAWNSRQTEDAMRWPDYRTFRRDCLRAERALLFAGYRLYPNAEAPS